METHLRAMERHLPYETTQVNVHSLTDIITKIPQWRSMCHKQF